MTISMGMFSGSLTFQLLFFLSLQKHAELFLGELDTIFLFMYAVVSGLNSKKTKVPNTLKGALPADARAKWHTCNILYCATKGFTSK